MAGRIVQSEGVFMMRDLLGQKLLLGKGDVVFAGDCINAGEGGGAPVRLPETPAFMGCQ